MINHPLLHKLSCDSCHHKIDAHNVRANHTTTCSCKQLSVTKRKLKNRYDHIIINIRPHNTNYRISFYFYKKSQAFIAREQNYPNNWEKLCSTHDHIPFSNLSDSKLIVLELETLLTFS